MLSSLQSWLFPPALTLLYGFTTSPYVSLSQITTAQLADSSLGVFKVQSGTMHPVVPGPNRNESAWEAVYPAGSYNPNGAIRGGFGFYLKGPKFFAQRLSTANEVLTSYSVMFESDWDWVEGGKLPGQCRISLNKSNFPVPDFKFCSWWCRQFVISLLGWSAIRQNGLL